MNQGPKELLLRLNNLKLGEISAVDAELAGACRALEAMGQGELSGRLQEARAHLKTGDLRAFRRALATVAARLGHLK